MNRVPKISNGVPKVGNRFTRALGLLMLKLMGWRIKGEIPNRSKMVLAAAPHTSNWDFIVAMSAMLAMGLKLSFIMKKEAFLWPFKGLFLKLGGVPVDRDQASDVVQQLSHWFYQSDQAWLAITPEGTRKKVDRWKTGFLRIATAAKVPVLLMAWDYPSKTLHCVAEFKPSGDIEFDMLAIRRVYSQYRGCHPERESDAINVSALASTDTVTKAEAIAEVDA